MEYFICIVYLAFSCSGMYLLKKSNFVNSQLHLNFIGYQLDISFVYIAGLLCYALSFLLFTVVIKKFNLSFMIPILSGIINIIVMIIGISVFDEKITLLKVIGVVFIALGVTLVGFSE